MKSVKKRSWPTVGTVIDSEYISDISSGSTVGLHRYMFMYSIQTRGAEVQLCLLRASRYFQLCSMWYEKM